MKHSIITIISFLLAFYTYSQEGVGINTLNPKGFFHIDAASNTDASNIYTDDIIVDNMGRLAFGHNTTATARIDIASPPFGSLILQDGSQANQRLLQSDADGRAFWQTYSTSSKKIISNAPINFEFPCKNLTGQVMTPIPFPSITIDMDGNYMIIIRMFASRRRYSHAENFDAGYFEFYVNGAKKDQVEHYLVINDEEYFSFDVPFFFIGAKKNDVISFGLLPSRSHHWYITPNANDLYKPCVILVKI